MVAASRLPLSRTVIADAALKLVELHGFDYLTMRRLGESLNVDAMSLYYHFENKDDLLDVMLERLYDSVIISGPPDEADDAFASWLRAIHRMFEHPAALELYSRRVATSPAGPRGVLWSGTRLLRRGLNPEEAAMAYRLTAAFVTGFAFTNQYVSDLAEAAKSCPTAEDPEVRQYLSHIQQVDAEAAFEVGLQMLARALVDNPKSVSSL